jgi:hypothetical protein
MDAPDTAAPKPRRASAALPRLPRVRLDSLDRVRREMAKLYIEGRSGRRDVQDVSRLANVLALIGRVIEGGELEKRIEALEQAKT